MKTKMSSLMLVFTFMTSICNAQTIEVSCNIGQHTIWNVDTVKMVGDITVENNADLKIISSSNEILSKLKLIVTSKPH